MSDPEYKLAIIRADTHEVHCVWEPDEIEEIQDALAMHNFDVSEAVVMSPAEFVEWKRERGID